MYKRFFVKTKTSISTVNKWIEVLIAAVINTLLQWFPKSDTV